MRNVLDRPLTVIAALALTLVLEMCKGDAGNTGPAGTMGDPGPAGANQPRVIAVSTAGYPGAQLTTTCANTGARSVTVTAPAGVAGQVILTGSVEFDINHANPTADLVTVYFGTAATTCATYSGQVYIPGAAASGLYEHTIGVSGGYALAAGTTTTYYLNMFGNITFNHYYSRLSALFVPN